MVFTELLRHPYLKEMRDNYRIKGENILTLFLLFEVFDILCDPFS